MKIEVLYADGNKNRLQRFYEAHRQQLEFGIGVIVLSLIGLYLGYLLSFWYITHYMLNTIKVGASNDVSIVQDDAINGFNQTVPRVYSVGYPVCLQNCLDDSLDVQAAAGYRVLNSNLKIK